MQPSYWWIKKTTCFFIYLSWTKTQPKIIGRAILAKKISYSPPWLTSNNILFFENYCSKIYLNVSKWSFFGYWEKQKTGINQLYILILIQIIIYFLTLYLFTKTNQIPFFTKYICICISVYINFYLNKIFGFVPILLLVIKYICFVLLQAIIVLILVYLY